MQDPCRIEFFQVNGEDGWELKFTAKLFKKDIDMMKIDNHIENLQWMAVKHIKNYGALIKRSAFGAAMKKATANDVRNFDRQNAQNSSLDELEQSRQHEDEEYEEEKDEFRRDFENKFTGKLTLDEKVLNALKEHFQTKQEEDEEMHLAYQRQPLLDQSAVSVNSSSSNSWDTLSSREKALHDMLQKEELVNDILEDFQGVKLDTITLASTTKEDIPTKAPVHALEPITSESWETLNLKRTHADIKASHITQFNVSEDPFEDDDEEMEQYEKEFPATPAKEDSAIHKLSAATQHLQNKSQKQKCLDLAKKAQLDKQVPVVFSQKKPFCNFTSSENYINMLAEIARTNADIVERNIIINNILTQLNTLVNSSQELDRTCNIM